MMVGDKLGDTICGRDAINYRSSLIDGLARAYGLRAASISTTTGEPADVPRWPVGSQAGRPAGRPARSPAHPTAGPSTTRRII